MARKRKKGKPRKKAGGLAGVSATKAVLTHKDIAVILACFAGGTIVGTAFGKYSGIPGALITAGGVWKKNLFFSSFGTGMLLSVVPVIQEELTAIGSEPAQELTGFSIKMLGDNTKSYFLRLKEKLLIPTGSSMNGLSGKEQVTYFMNPYTQGSGKLDLSELDKIQAEIADMSVQVTGIELEESYRNF